MPLRRGGEVIGALAAARRQPAERFSPVAAEISRRLAHLASLALEVGRLIETLEEANRLKSDFVATISHELRTPMNIIMGYNELLGEEAFGPLSADQRRVLRAMSRSANQLLELINSTLDLSRLEAGRLPLSLADVDPAALLRTLREDIGPPESAAVRLVWNLPRAGAAVRTDAVKLKVIVKNLVQNALKFTREGTVMVRARRRRGGLEIAVADTGIGIEPSALPAIFESFRQLEPSVTRHHGGVGLGLYIVRRMVELLDGTIEVESTPGRGSTFCVWVPSAPA